MSVLCDFELFCLRTINPGFELSYVKAIVSIFFFDSRLIINAVLRRTVDLGCRFRFHTSRPYVNKFMGCQQIFALFIPIDFCVSTSMVRHSEPGLDFASVGNDPPGRERVFLIRCLQG